MAIRLDTNYNVAAEQLQMALDNSATVIVGTMVSPIKHMGNLQHIDMEAVEFEEVETDAKDAAYSNICLNIAYTTVLPNCVGRAKATTVENTLTLILLTTAGDIEWHTVLKNKVWNGNYPSTVGVNVNTGEVYCVFVQSGLLELRLFGTLTELDKEGLLDHLNYKKPYKITISYDALWDYAAELEGSRYLRDNLQMEFDCGRPVVLPLSLDSEV